MTKAEADDLEEKEDLEEQPYERLVERLEEVVETLEQGDLPLERSLKLFEEGVTLSREASGRLDGAERRIEELMSEGSLVPLSTENSHPSHDEG